MGLYLSSVASLDDRLPEHRSSPEEAPMLHVDAFGEFFGSPSVWMKHRRVASRALSDSGEAA